MSCFIRGCKTGYLSERKKNKENNCKNLSFFYARNDEMLHAWQNAIRHNAIQPKSNKILGKKDRVCELHFKEMDIERDYVTRLSNGDISRIPKGRVTLKAGAIPCLFSKQATTRDRKMSVTCSEIETHATADHSIPEEKKCNIPIPEIPEIKVINPVASVENACNSGDAKSSDHLLLQRIITDTHGTQVSSEPTQNQLDVSNDIVPGVSNESLFDRIVKNLASIAAPSDSWISGSAYGNVMWTLWKKDLSVAEYQVVLYPDMALQIYVEGRIVSVPGTETLGNIIDVPKILQKVTMLLPCKTIDGEKRIAECAGYVLRKKQHQPGPQRQRCDACRKRQKTILMRSRKMGPLERQQNQLSNIRGRYANIRRRNQRLKYKVVRLKRKVQSIQDECARCDINAIAKATSKLPPNQKVAVEACFASSKVKSANGMRYTNQWIYECMLLRIKSSQTYEHLRTHKILALPCIKTLEQYMKVIERAYGFGQNVFNVLRQKTARQKTARQKTARQKTARQKTADRHGE